MMQSAGSIIRGASFDELARVMKPVLKPNVKDRGLRATMRRLLREMERDGLVVNNRGYYRLADALDPELREALFYLTTFTPSADDRSRAA